MALAVAGARPELGFLYLVGFIPFLGRLIAAARFTQAARLGFMFGAALLAASPSADCGISCLVLLAMIALAGGLAGVLASVVFLCSHRYAVSPFMIASLWISQEILWRFLGGGNALLTGAVNSSPIIHGTALTFGLLLIAFFIVAVNCLLLAIAGTLLKIMACPGSATGGTDRTLPAETGSVLDLPLRLYHTPWRRGPPAGRIPPSCTIGRLHIS